MSVLSYPFDSAEILKRKRKIKKELLADNTSRIKKRIAVLGGSTTNDIVDAAELFLLNNGIEPSFYQSEYAMYWQDAMFGNDHLSTFNPDIVFVHTSTRNLEKFFPCITDSAEQVEKCISDAKQHFTAMWDKLDATYHCPIIQNNFELPNYRILGNRDAYDIHGVVYFVQQMNVFVSQYAMQHKSFYVNDINYVSACYGLDGWHDLSCWYMYKYTMALNAIPYFSYNLVNIIKSIFGKNKKALALDLDNTLWGGIVGDDGVDGLELGSETPTGQAYQEFQQYIKKNKDIGVMLTVCSKNDMENAIAGLNHPDSALKPDDFLVIKANWEPKNYNIAATAKELNIMSDAIVFADDNPVEREIVKQSLPVSVPPMVSVDKYIQTIDRSGFFEVTTLSEDDLKRNEMYKANALREQEMHTFADYGDYLISLDMRADINAFAPVYIQRIAQLTNKSNQFNVTTKRYTAEEITTVAESDEYIDLYGKLTDKFGDNGVVSVVIGKKEKNELNIDLWIMSCRVLKRDMEFAMLDALVEKCAQQGIDTINGYYYPTQKNSMVKELFGTFGFTKISEDNDGNTTWSLKVKEYRNKNRYIAVN